MIDKLFNKKKEAKKEIVTRFGVIVEDTEVAFASELREFYRCESELQAIEYAKKQKKLNPDFEYSIVKILGIAQIPDYDVIIKDPLQET